MKNIFKFLFLMLLSLSVKSQPLSSEIIRLKKDNKNWDNISKVFEISTNKYIETEEYLRNRKGIIVIKILNLNINTCEFIIDYFISKNERFDYLKNITNYYEYDSTLILFNANNYSDILNEKLDYKKFEISILDKEIYKNKLVGGLTFINDSTISLTVTVRDEWTVAHVKYNKNKIHINYYKNYNYTNKIKH